MITLINKKGVGKIDLEAQADCGYNILANKIL